MEINPIGVEQNISLNGADKGVKVQNAEPSLIFGEKQKADVPRKDHNPPAKKGNSAPKCMNKNKVDYVLRPMSERAGETIEKTNQNGTVIKMRYNKEGYCVQYTEEYPDGRRIKVTQMVHRRGYLEKHSISGKTQFEVFLDDNCNPIIQKEFVYSEDGQLKRTIYRDANGKLLNYEDYDGNRIIYRDANGGLIACKTKMSS